MKIRYLIAIVAGVAAVLLLVLAGQNVRESAPVPDPVPSRGTASEEAPLQERESPVAVSDEESDRMPAPRAGEQATLKIGDQEFASDLEEGQSVYGLMERLREEEGLIFESRPFSGLGYFIVSIGGVKNDETSGTYWTLYKNGKRSSVGASSLILSQGDRIEWRFEKGSDDQ